MRKYLLCLVITLLSYSGFGQLLTEGFEGATFPPAGWTTFIGTNGYGTTQNWKSSTIAHTGTKSAYVSYEAAPGLAEDWMVTPAINLTNYSDAQLSFYTRQEYSPNYGSMYYVLVSTASQTNHADFTTVASWTESTLNTTYNIWVEKTVDLSAYVGQTIYVAFVMTNQDGDSWFVDDVTVTGTEIPTGCLGGSLWPTGTVTPTCGSTTTITGSYAGEYSNVQLTAGTTYTFTCAVTTDYLTIANAAGTTVLAGGVGPLSFTPTTSGVYRFYSHKDAACTTENITRSKYINCILPECVAPISTFPFTETFETSSVSRNCWSNEFVSGTTTWTYRAGQGSTYGSVNTAHGGSLNASFYASGSTAYTTKLVSPKFDFTGQANPTLTFWYSNQDWEGDLNELRVYYKVGSGTWNLIPSAEYTTNVAEWTEVTLVLPSAAGAAEYTIAFEGKNGWGHGITLDDVVVDAEELPSGCLSGNLWPTSTVTIPCIGLDFEVTNSSYAGEYSNVMLEATEYTFSSSVATDYITISNAAGTEVLAGGPSPVVFTPSTAGQYRYYVHKNSACQSESAVRTKYAKCGTPHEIIPPDFDCYQGDGLATDGTPIDGLYVGADEIFKAADDFIVEPGTVFTLQQIRLNVLSLSNIVSGTFRVLNDDGGIPGDEVLYTFTMAPTSQYTVGYAFGYPNRELTFDLATPQEFTEGTYWLQPLITNQNSDAVYWESTETGSNGSTAAVWEEGEWILDPDYQQVFFVSGECEVLPTCPVLDVPYLQDFQTAVVPNMPECTTVETFSGNSWLTNSTSSNGFTTTHLRYSWHSSQNADTWFYTHGINLTAGVSYTISYDYGGTGSTFPEKMKVAYGTANTASAMTTVIADHPNIVNSAPLNNAVSFTPSTTGVYYFGFQAYSNSDQFRLFLDNILIEEGEVEPPLPGCLSGSLWPSTAFTPTCTGFYQDITTNGYAGEYSNVVLTEGVTYTFTSGITTDFITIANAAGNTVLASGTAPVVYTPSASGTVRFYTHTNDSCGTQSVDRARAVKCGTAAEVEYDCDQTYSGAFSLANSINTALNYYVANDFFVPMESPNFKMLFATFLVVIPSATSTVNDFGDFTLSILNDNSTAPGTVVETFTGITPNVVEHTETFANYKTYYLTFELPDGGYELPVNPSADTRYWMSITGVTTTGQNIFLVGQKRADEWVTAPNYQSADGGATYAQIFSATSGGTFDSHWSFDADCEAIAEPEGCLEAGNGQWPSGAPFTPSCVGIPQNITTSGWTGEYSLVNVTAGTEYIFSSSINTDYVTISDQAGTTVYAAGTTPVTWTATFTGVVRFYLHLDSDCSWASTGTRTRIVQCGEIVPPPANDDCANAIAVACGETVTGSTVLATNSGGNTAPDVFYSFTGSGSPQTVTVSLCNSSYDTYVRIYTDCSLTTQIAQDDDGCGTTRSEVSFESDGTSTYYIMVEGYGSNSGAYEMNISCQDPVVFDDPDFACYQGDGSISAIENGYGIQESDIYRVAEDFVVAPGTEFTLRQVTMSILSSTGVTQAKFRIHEDNAGLPGDIIETIDVAPSYNEIYGTAFGFNAHRVEFTLATPIVLGEGTYWLDVTTPNNTYWVNTTSGSDGSFPALSNTSGTSWVPETDGFRMVFYVEGDCDTVTEPEDGCLEAENGQYPSTTFTPSCSGAPEVITSLAWTGEYSMVNVTAGTEYVFSSSIPTDFITISDENATTVYAAGTTPVTWTATANETVRFYLHFDSDCNWAASGLRSRIVQCGDILPPPSNDDCANAIEVSCGDSVSGDTTFANNSGGNAAGDVFYKFTGDGTPQYVTASLCGSSYDTYIRIFTDCTLSNEVAFNDDFCGLQSEVTFLSDGTSTYYILVEGFSSNVGAFVLNISCNDVPPPPSDCEDFEVLSNNLENGLFFGGDTAQRLAVDVPVADAGFTVFGMEPTVAGEASSFNFTIYADGGGLPGAQITTRTGIITGSVVTGNNFGFDFIKYTVQFNEPFDMEANTTYWIEVESDAVAWESTSAFGSMLGNGDVFWNTNVSGWTSTGGDEFVFNLLCTPVGLDDLTSFDFAYYPNPVKDVLNFTSKKGVESVEIFNLAGQRVMNNAKVTNNQINVDALTPGTYVFRVTLEGGQIETFKIIKM